MRSRLSPLKIDAHQHDVHVERLGDGSEIRRLRHEPRRGDRRLDEQRFETRERRRDGVRQTRARKSVSASGRRIRNGSTTRRVRDGLAVGCGSTWPAGSGAVDTCARKRWPRRPTVSTNRGLPASSSNAARRRLIALFKLLSKSTNVSSDHSRFRNSSRVTWLPGRSTSASSTRRGLSWRRSRTPSLLSSPAAQSSSNRPKPDDHRQQLSTHVREI